MKTKLGLSVLTAIFLFLFSVTFLAASRVAATEKTDKESILGAYGKLPLYFIENRGQLDSEVRFYVKTFGQTLYFTDEGIIFDLFRRQEGVGKGTEGEETGLQAKVMKRERLVFNLVFENAQKGVLIAGLGRQAASINSFMGNDKTKWHTGIPTYRGVVYKDVYRGIDLKVFGKGKDIEYEFIVNPGGNPNHILLTYTGIEGLSANGEGELLIGTAFGELKESRPYIYQKIEGERAVDGRFEIHENIAQSQPGKFSYGFQVAAYDSALPLIIDPVLSYSTYLGGSGYDWGTGIAVDGAGNAYVTGYTESNNFPTKNPYQGTRPGGQDAFITKLSPSGTTLVYSTYLGGDSIDWGRGIAVDASGNAYVTGGTASADFPTKNPYQGTGAGYADVFITKLSPLGALIYSTYLGGSSSDYGNSIAVDDSENVYVTGDTVSVQTVTEAGFPVKNAYQAVGGGHNAFITKLSPLGTTLVYSTYLGGSARDDGRGIAVDSSGNACVTGQTFSSNFPTQNAYQGSIGGLRDAFITKLSPSGTALVYSTYLGGSQNDNGTGIAVDGSGNAYVTGDTGSEDFPTKNAYQPEGSGGDVFVTKVASSGSVVYSTYLGATSASGKGIAVNALGNAYVIGTGWGIPMKDPYQETVSGGADAFVTKFSSSGTSLIYSTYLGGDGLEEGLGIAVDSAGIAYVTGKTRSSDFPTKNAYQEKNAGGYDDAFITKFSPPSCAECSEDAVTLSGVIFSSETDCECAAATSITIGPSVTIESGAAVIFTSPSIKTAPETEIKDGALVIMRQP